MKTLFIICILLIFKPLSAQSPINYDSLRLQGQFSVCQVVRDSSSNEDFIMRLTDLDTALMASGLSNYYRDLGFGYYKKYIYTKDSLQLKKAIEMTNRGWYADKTNVLAAWDLGIYYFLIGDCNLSKLYFENYKTAMKLKNKKLSREDKNEIKRLSNSSKCSKK